MSENEKQPGKRLKVDDLAEDPKQIKKETARGIGGGTSSGVTTPGYTPPPTDPNATTPPGTGG